MTPTATTLRPPTSCSKRRRRWVARAAQRLRRFEHEVGGLNVVAVGVMVGDGAPVVREVKVHCARLDADSVAHDCEQLLKAAAKRRVLPDFVELREGFEQVYVRVH